MKTEETQELPYVCPLAPHTHVYNCSTDAEGKYTCGGHEHSLDCYAKLYDHEEHSHSEACGCVKQEMDAEKDFREILTYTDNTCIEFAKDISKPRSTTSSDTGVRGVILKDGKYQAQTVFQKKRYYLGRYSRLEDAIEIRRKAEAQVEEYVEEHLSGNPSPSVNFDF